MPIVLTGPVTGSGFERSADRGKADIATEYRRNWQPAFRRIKWLLLEIQTRNVAVMNAEKYTSLEIQPDGTTIFSAVPAAVMLN